MLVKRRLYSMLLDHMIMTFVFMVPWIVFFTIYQSSPSDIGFKGKLMVSGFLLLYVNKDSIHGQSIAKRIVGFRVIDSKTGRPATSLQCLIRNTFIPILWPIEVLVTILNPNRRIGDRFTNTQVEKTDKKRASSILSDLRNVKFNFRTTLINVVVLIFLLIFDLILASI